MRMPRRISKSKAPGRPAWGFIHLTRKSPRKYKSFVWEFLQLLRFSNRNKSL
jgi:hypothetical protein